MRPARPLHPSFLIALALTALLLPAGWGLLVLAPACLARARDRGLTTTQVLGLGLLALIPFLARPPPADGTGTDIDEPPWRVALELEGRWRVPPGSAPYLATRAGPVAVRLASGVRAPGLGRPVVVRGVAEPGRPFRIVSVEEVGEVSGAWIDRWSRACDRRLAELVPPDLRGLVGALVLGRRGELSFELSEAARATGTLHLFALSGLHVGLVVGLIEALGRLLGVRSRLLRGALLVPFALLAGARPSLVRATTGWCLASLAASRHRSGRPLLRLGTVALLLLVWDPSLADDLSAQLSFVAVAGLLSVARMFDGRFALWFAPAGAFLATAPLVAETFGRVQPWGLVVTPFLVPLVAGILALGLIGIVAGPCFSLLDPLVGPALVFLGDRLGDALWWAARWCPPPVWPGPLPVPGFVAALLVVGALATLARYRPGPRGEATVGTLQRWAP